MKILKIHDQQIMFVPIKLNDDQYDIDSCAYTSLYNDTSGQTECTLFNNSVNCKILMKASNLDELFCQELLDMSSKDLQEFMQLHQLHIHKWLEQPIDIYYLPEFGCQKYPQECYLSDLEKHRRHSDIAAEDYLLILIY